MSYTAQPKWYQFLAWNFCYAIKPCSKEVKFLTYRPTHPSVHGVLNQRCTSLACPFQNTCRTLQAKGAFSSGHGCHFLEEMPLPSSPQGNQWLIIVQYIIHCFRVGFCSRKRKEKVDQSQTFPHFMKPTQDEIK